MTVAATLASTVDDAMVRSFSLFVKGSMGACQPLAGETEGTGEGLSGLFSLSRLFG